MSNKIIKNIPNMITVSRIITSILAGILFVNGNFGLSIGLYSYAAISDMFDGMLARKLNAHSELGRRLDAISDKLFVGSLIFPTLFLGNVLMAIPLYYELKISLYNLNATRKVKRVTTERIGKFKTALLFPTLILGLISCQCKSMYFLLAPLLTETVKLQENTYKSYKKQVKERKRCRYIEENNNIIYNKEVSLKDNLIYLRNELITYLNYEQYSDVKRKELRR